MIISPHFFISFTYDLPAITHLKIIDIIDLSKFQLNQ